MLPMQSNIQEFPRFSPDLLGIYRRDVVSPLEKWIVAVSSNPSIDGAKFRELVDPFTKLGLDFSDEPRVIFGCIRCLNGGTLPPKQAFYTAKFTALACSGAFGIRHYPQYMDKPERKAPNLGDRLLGDSGDQLGSAVFFQCARQVAAGQPEIALKILSLFSQLSLGITKIDELAEKILAIEL